MAPDLNVPYAYLDFDGKNLFLVGFFQAGSQLGYSPPILSVKPIPGGDAQFLDVQISAINTGNNFNFDGTQFSVTPFLNCQFILVTQTNQGGITVKTKVHLEPATPDGV